MELEEEEDKRQTGIITRLVFGGNVIDQNDLVVGSSEFRILLSGYLFT